MDGIGKTQAGQVARGQQATTPLSRFSRFRLWLAGYDALEVIAARDNDHLLRDAGMSRDEARDGLRPWRIIGFLLLPRSGGD